MSTVIFWFRSDLRLHGQPALAVALRSGATHLVPVVCHPPEAESTPWGFPRWGVHRRAFVTAAVQALADRLAALGTPLVQLQGSAAQVLPALARSVGATRVVCEDIAAPYEQDEIAALRAAGLQVRTVWHSSLIDPVALPWGTRNLPDVFTAFRNGLERKGVQPPLPLAEPPRLLPPPPGIDVLAASGLATAGVEPAAPRYAAGATDARSSFPYGLAAFNGSETAARAHLAQYLARKLPHSYKATRNGLTGIDYSSKFSPWLATGALSARQVMTELRAFEQAHGANDGSYWLWFELLWRDYFRFLHLQHGRTLYRARGLGTLPPPTHNPLGFARWCEGRTGEPLVDAAMRELATTGYLSNRLRQMVASYLIHDLQGDWRAGAAWFEAQLVDYDPYSNQGNWLYVAGRGTDPRGGRRFNPQKQAQEHDADGSYRHMWGTA
ncbi:DASH family cryptochrome [Acidovorax sp. BL-A-41-H1]|uniref:DASH family cryptochrome n=1 Tax=Acidovorax sp. BL-A-41-H1 TaxID=3421102 RepID=UPI003F7B13F7